MFTQDFILNGSAHGPVAETLEGMRFDTGMMRPFIDEHGVRCVTVNSGRTKFDKELGTEVPIFKKMPIAVLKQQGIDHPVFNTTSLRKQEWQMLDRQVLAAARYRLRAWGDLASANSFGGFNGMGKMILEHETMSDPGNAVVDFDGLTDGRTDAPKFQLEGLPLPITHSDFWFSSRRLAVSRGSGTPLDSTMAEAAGRRVAEMVEKTLIGNVTGVTYGGGSATPTYGRASTVFGYTNFTNRLTKTNLTAPTAGGWVPSTLLSEVLSMRNSLYNNKFYGPFMLYHSAGWDQYLDNDYYVSITSGAVAPQKTLRERLRAIEGITDVRRLDMLFASTPAATTGPGGEIDTATNAYTLLMVQMTSDVCRAVNGMDMTTVQWESQGGMRLNFKVMCIYVPQLRADYYGNCGIMHATTA